MFLCVAVFLVSLLFSSFGMGGGMFYMPLFLFFTSDYYTASFLSFFCILMTSCGAVLTYHRKGLVDWRLVKILGLPLVGMVFFSAFLVSNLPVNLIKGILGVTLIWAGLSMIFPAISRSLFCNVSDFLSKRFPDQAYSFSPVILAPLTAVIGFLSGVSGLAGGVFGIPLMAVVLRSSAHTAVGTSSAIIFLSGFLGVAGRLLHSSRLCLLDEWWLIALLMSAFAGARLGPRFSLSIKPDCFKRICGIFILGIGNVTVFKFLVNIFH